MDVVSFSDIFDDPNLSEFTDNFLNDFDINDFNGYAPDSTVHPSYACDTPDVKAKQDNASLLDRSSHTTLEALLKSHLPSSCVPPAPDLHSDLSALGDRNFPSKHLRRPPGINHYRRNSLPVVKRDFTGLSGVTKFDPVEANGKSKLICNYLKKCTTEECDVQNQKAACPVTDSLDIIDQSKGARRAPHNAIEKRYRASINGRIDELRKILIPNPDRDAKLNKSAVLRQAIDHIRDLERKNEMLRSEISALRAMQSAGLSKSSHSSPESGISSFEPSPSLGSTNLDFGHLTPSSSGASCGSLFQTSVGNITGAVSCDGTDIPSDALDTCLAPWSIASGTCQTSLIADQLGPPTAAVCFSTPETDAVAMPLSSLLNDSDTRYHLPVYDKQPTQRNAEFFVASDSLPCRTAALTDSLRYHYPVSSNRYKRGSAEVIQQPLKIRREDALSTQLNNAQTINRHGLRHTHLLVRNSLSSCASSSSSSDSFPNVRHPFSSQRVSTECSSDFNPKDNSSCVYAPTSAFNSMAARTSLCVSALCLIALNPAAFTQSSGPRLSSRSESTPSRQLLYATSPSSIASSMSWFALLIYAIQWIVALCLCLWACRKSPRLSVSPNLHPSVPTALKKLACTHWEKAMAAIRRNSWSLADSELRLYLSAMGAPLVVHPMATSEKLSNSLLCRLHRCLCWVFLMTKAVYIVSIKCLLLVRLMFSNRNANSLPKVSVRPVDKNIKPSVTGARLLLLEVHTLARLGCNDKADNSVVDTLSSAQLALACAEDFFKGLLRHMHRSNCLTTSSDVLSPSLTLKEGFVLLLALKMMSAPKWLERILMNWIVCLTDSVTGTNVWSSFAANSVLTTLVLGLSRDKLLKHARHLSSVDIERLLRLALLPNAMNYCLHTLVYDNELALRNLDSLISSLLQLSRQRKDNKAITSSAPKTTTVFCADIERIEWWVYFVRASWSHRMRSLDPSFADVHTTILCPSKSVLDCPHTGHLAESIWLSYRTTEDGGLSNSDQPTGCIQRVANLLHMHSIHMPGCSTVGETNASTELHAQSIPLLTLLATSWILAIATKSLRASWQHPQSNHVGRSGGLLIFNMALRVLHQSSSSLGVTKPDWVLRQCSHALAVRRVTLGGNPLHSRLALLHAWRTLPKSTNSSTEMKKIVTINTAHSLPVTGAQADEAIPSNADTSPDFADHASSEQPFLSLQKHMMQVMKHDRVTLITQSPGQ